MIAPPRPATPSNSEENPESPPSLPSTGAVWLYLRNAAIVAIWLVGLFIGIRLVLLRSYNYDEISHAHTAWLISSDEVPYRQFAMNHLPFFRTILSPLLGLLPPAPVTLTCLRFGALALNALFVCALGALVLAKLKPAERIWGAAVIGLFATSSFVLQFLVELRSDALANALLFLSIFWLLGGANSSPTWKNMLAGFLIGTAVLVNTKYMLLPLLLGIVAGIDALMKKSAILPVMSAIALGCSVALLGGWLVLVSFHISVSDVWTMVVKYNLAVEQARTFGYGMAVTLTRHPLLLAASVAGILSYLVSAVHRKIHTSPFEISALLFLLLSLLTTTRPWKQYAASWLLLAAVFSALAGARAAVRLSSRRQFVLAAALLAGAVIGWSRADFADPDGTPGVSRREQHDLIEFAGQHLSQSDYVVAGFPLHPVFWRDSFFKVVIDMRGAGGDNLERTLPTLAAHDSGARWRQSGYAEQLEQRPPSLIVTPTLLTEAQNEAVSDYLKGHGADYQHFTLPASAVGGFLRGGGARSMRSPSEAREVVR
jgi:hypothetical protein